jgi:hypothetical protein
LTGTTRRRVVVCLVAVALTLPIETFLLKAISTPSVQDAAHEWVANLTPDNLDAAASQVQAYPVAYRRAIMRALPAQARVVVWRRHIRDYIDAHPGLSPAAVAVLDEARDLITPELLSDPSSADRAQAARLGSELVALIGRDEAEHVLYRLGPRDGTFASREPFGERLANWVRGLVVAFARAESCDCATGWGCDGMGTYCRANTGCTVDTDWPMCGWLWSETCDGLCYAGMS